MQQLQHQSCPTSRKGNLYLQKHLVELLKEHLLLIENIFRLTYHSEYAEGPVDDTEPGMPFL